ALAHPVGAAAPAGVHQPYMGTVLLHALAEHVGVLGGVQRQEGCPEAGAEHGLGLGDAGLGARHLGGIPAEEPVHGLAGGEPADGGQHAVGVAGEEEDVLGVAAHAGHRVVADVLDGVAHAGVFRFALVGEIHAGLVLFLEGDVLQQGAEFHGIPDLRLLFAAQVDALGVAAALEVEHAVLAPAVLIIADELAVRVGAQGGLARAAEAEEDGGVAGL